MSLKQTPKYVRLKQEILSWLASGQLKPDEQMPSEHEIAARFGLSRQTVRQALGELEQEGWLYRIQGKGTFVAHPPEKVAGASDMRMIAMVTTYISDYIFPHIVRGAESVLRSRGYSLTLSSTDNDKEKERENLIKLFDRPFDGFIIEPTKSAQGNPNLDLYLKLQAMGKPFVMIHERYPELYCPCLKTDDEAGTYLAAKHLIELGHRNIAGFFKVDDLQGSNRMKGFVRALREFGIPLKPDTITPYTTETLRTVPREAALNLLKREPGSRPTAFVCYNDELAVRLLEAPRTLGLLVPEDLSVVGFDDSPLAVATEVKLTTVVHPKEEMGMAAARLLVDLIEGREPPGQQDIVYPPKLIIRESTRAL